MPRTPRLAPGPRFLRLKGHNNLLEAAAFNNPDEQLSREVLDFMYLGRWPKWQKLHWGGRGAVAGRSSPLNLEMNDEAIGKEPSLAEPPFGSRRAPKPSPLQKAFEHER